MCTGRGLAQRMMHAQPHLHSQGMLGPGKPGRSWVDEDFHILWQQGCAFHKESWQGVFPQCMLLAPTTASESTWLSRREAKTGWGRSRNSPARLSPQRQSRHSPRFQRGSATRTPTPVAVSSQEQSAPVVSPSRCSHQVTNGVLVWKNSYLAKSGLCDHFRHSLKVLSIEAKRLFMTGW